MRSLSALSRPTIRTVIARLTQSAFHPVAGWTLTRGWTRSTNLGPALGSLRSRYGWADRYTAFLPSMIFRKSGDSFSYAEYPLAQSVSPPIAGTVSLWRCVTPAGCFSCTKSVCHLEAPPGLRKSALRSVAWRSGQMTLTPETPGTCGAWGFSRLQVSCHRVSEKFRYLRGLLSPHTIPPIPSAAEV